MTSQDTAAAATCGNCGAEVLPQARFCHLCAAPVQPAAAVEVSPGRPFPIPAWLSRIAFRVLVVVNVALVVLAVLVFAFGFLVEN